MRITRQKDRLTLTLNFLECTVLRRAFAEIATNYKLKPDEVDPKIAAHWYSTRGCKSAKMSAEETADWLANLHHFKGANLHRIESWQQALTTRKTGQYQMELGVDEGHTLITVLNDHRLLTAGRYNIGQEEMDTRSATDYDELKPIQQAALYSIHFLACVIEEVLRHVSPEASSWMQDI
jgi:hypothetical protein